MFIHKHLENLFGAEGALLFSEFFLSLTQILSINRIFVVGSFATGTQQATSDLDLLIISIDFSQYTLSARQQIIFQSIHNSSVKLDCYCYTPEEYFELEKDDFWKTKTKVEVWNNEYEEIPC